MKQESVRPIVRPLSGGPYKNVRDWWECPNCGAMFDFDRGTLVSNETHDHCIECGIFWDEPIHHSDPPASQPPF